MATKETLPNSRAVLVLGICSIIIGYFSFKVDVIFGITAVILGIIGRKMGWKGRVMYTVNPELYNGYDELNAGRIMSIIGIIIGVMRIIRYVDFWSQPGM